MKKELIIYQGKNGEIEFKGDIQKETLWATQSQISDLFGVDRSVITKHIKDIFSDEELNREVVSAKFAHTTPHGVIKGKTQTKDIKTVT